MFWALIFVPVIFFVIIGVKFNINSILGMSAFFLALAAFALGRLFIAFALVALAYYFLKFWKPQDPGTGAGPGEF